MSSDGDQPAAKRQKKYEADGPVEDEESAREKLREAGFDPDDAHSGRSDLEPPRSRYGQFMGDVVGSWYNITPMTYFAFHGDLPMCRYLHHVRGSSTTCTSVEWSFWYPAYAAAFEGKYEILKWMFLHGAKTEVCRAFKGFIADLSNENEAAKGLLGWLIMNGAFHDDTDKIDKSTVRRLLVDIGYLRFDNVLFGESRAAFPCLSWSENVLRSSDSFLTFLLGTWAPGYSADGLKRLLTRKTGNADAASLIVDSVVASGSSESIWKKLVVRREPAHNECLGRHPGVLETIADFVGYERSKTKKERVRSFRGAVSLLTEQAVVGDEDNY